VRPKSRVRKSTTKNVEEDVGREGEDKPKKRRKVA